MTNDTIKRMCADADGFEYEEGDFIDDCYVRSPSGIETHILEFDSTPEWFKERYPLLLQRAIEGINKKNIDNASGFYIEQREGQIIVCQYCAPYILFEIEDINKAKESALEYIYEQEQKGDSDEA